MDSQINRYEKYGAKKYLEYTENDSYRAFFDPAIPDSFEFNYGVLKAEGNAMAGLAHIELRFTGSGMQPRIWSRPDSAALAEVRPLLLQNGWNICEYSTMQMHLAQLPAPTLMRHQCNVKMFAKPVTGAEYQLLLQNYDGQTFGPQMMNKQIAAGAKLFAAYDAWDVPVSMCLANVYGSLLYVENLYTAPASRRKGYAASVLTAMSRYAANNSFAEVWLDVDSKNADALRLYEQFGFRGSSVARWWAVQGDVPQWLQQT